tara:strand:- start:356301 stop:356555 length:255 start_codon:yes stop_codon:yes gene_type:complete
MFIKKGELAKMNEEEKPLLKTEAGKVFEVSYIVAYVWDKLDGETPLTEIESNISQVTKSAPEDVENIGQKIVDELLKVNLVQEV